MIKLTRALRVTAQWLSSGEGSMRGEGLPEGLAWPFRSVPYAAYLALTPREKHQLEQVLAAYIAARGRAMSAPL